jgi:hypothetical protein
VTIPSEHLRFDDRRWHRRQIAFTDIDAELRGQNVLALGTWSFVGAVMARLGVRYEDAFET